MPVVPLMWERKGLIYAPAWPVTYAQVPTVLVLDDRLRIFYADRTVANESFIAYLDVDRGDPSQVIFHHKGPILPLGKPGTFDDAGMMPSWVSPDGERLFYSGWNVGTSVRYRNAIGCIFSKDGKNWERRCEGPVMDRSVYDPYMVVTPWVAGGQMWYVSGTGWVKVNGRLEPLYVIKRAQANATSWVPDRDPCIERKHNLEAFSNPTVWREGDGYKMLFCSRDSVDYRGGAGSYRIRSAASKDGVDWERTDDGLNVSPEGWDSEQTAYPYVVQVDGRRLMFYNGNGFGKTGIGWAEWK
jgi:hypothetical protein